MSHLKSFKTKYKINILAHVRRIECENFGDARLQHYILPTICICIIVYAASRYWTHTKCKIFSTIHIFLLWFSIRCSVTTTMSIYHHIAHCTSPPHGPTLQQMNSRIAIRMNREKKKIKLKWNRYSDIDYALYPGRTSTNKNCKAISVVCFFVLN